MLYSENRRYKQMQKLENADKNGYNQIFSQNLTDYKV